MEVTVINAITFEPVPDIPILLRRYQKHSIRGIPSESIDATTADMYGKAFLNFKYDFGNEYKIQVSSNIHSDSINYFEEEKQNLYLEKGKNKITLRVWEKTFLKLRLKSNQAQNKVVHITNRINYSVFNTFSSPVIDTVVVLKVAKYGHNTIILKVDSAGFSGIEHRESLYYNGHDSTHYTINY